MTVEDLDLNVFQNIALFFVILTFHTFILEFLRPIVHTQYYCYCSIVKQSLYLLCTAFPARAMEKSKLLSMHVAHGQTTTNLDCWHGYIALDSKFNLVL